jgi:hypothetical protein
MLIREWTEEEELFLIENYSKFGSEYCSVKLNRPIGGIRKRAKKLKIKWKKVKKIYHKDFLENIIKESTNIGMVLDKLNLRKAGGNYKVINKYIIEYNLDVSHFISGKFKIGSSSKTKISLEEILVENSSYSRKNLKKRLYNDGILIKECCLCGQNEDWNGMKISLILDHINGIHNDNRIENLRIVCPNCNAGLDTFAGRNTKREKKEEIKKQEKTIKKQNINSRRKVERPSIDQLKKEVEEFGYSATGRKYGVSDNAVRKWIKNKIKENI